jgi:hypothetical protein
MFSQSGGSGARGCALVVLAGCASPRPVPLLESRPPPSRLGDTLTAARRAHGALLIVSSAGEITALTPDLEPVATIAHRTGHDGQVIGSTFYALGNRELFEVDLRTGALRVDAKLPPLHHACISDDDPTEHIEDGSRPAIDPKRGVACFRVQDRNDNMMSLAIDYRIDLRTGASQHLTVLALDECLDPGEAKEAPSPCEIEGVHDRSSAPRDTAPHALAEIGQEWGSVSRSARWATFTDDALGEEGDYIYSAVLLYDGASMKTYAITPTGPVAIDLPAAVAARKLPDGACYSPGEAPPVWAGDTLLVPGCGDGTLVVHPESGAVKTLPTQEFVVW